jgi:hypothetical protein
MRAIMVKNEIDARIDSESSLLCCYTIHNVVPILVLSDLGYVCIMIFPEVTQRAVTQKSKQTATAIISTPFVF